MKAQSDEVDMAANLNSNVNLMFLQQLRSQPSTDYAYHF